jgi:hypothetical protein
MADFYSSAPARLVTILYVSVNATVNTRSRHALNRIYPHRTEFKILAVLLPSRTRLDSGLTPDVFLLVGKINDGFSNLGRPVDIRQSDSIQPSQVVGSI